MAEKPILFNIEMVKAILEGRKTQTRRILKNDKIQARPTATAITIDAPYRTFLWHPMYCYKPETVRVPYQYGDVLWVREAFCPIRYKKPKKSIPVDFRENDFLYKADEIARSDGKPIKWRPSIHMPREAARLFLRVTSVRLERLQDISSSDVDAEGCKEYAYDVITGEMMQSRPTWFKILWDKTIQKADLPRYGWDANPWVWVIEFERCDRP